MDRELIVLEALLLFFALFSVLFSWTTDERAIARVVLLPSILIHGRERPEKTICKTRPSLQPKIDAGKTPFPASGRKFTRMFF